jgi:hypothetical protein
MPDIDMSTQLEDLRAELLEQVRNLNRTALRIKAERDALREVCTHMRSTLQSAQEWHRGDRWRNGGPAQIAAWVTMTDAIESALEASKPESIIALTAVKAVLQ